jgi:uncharacterized protein
VRAVLDVNVLIAALLSRSGAPAQLIGKWLAGEFELVVSERLLAELETTLARPKFRRHLDEGLTEGFLQLLRSGLAETVEDPVAAPAHRSSDPKDDYLIAAAASAQATLVTGDSHLHELKDVIPVLSPRALLDRLE